MKEQLAIQHLLRSRLADSQKNNPNYSLRAFSKKVGVDVGALSGILNGKRNISRTLAARIARNLLLDPQQRADLLALFPEKRSYQKSDTALVPPAARYLEFSASQFKIASEWEHFAVMSLLHCKDFKSSTPWISNRLGISETRATQVIDRLLKLDLLSIDSKGKLSRSKTSYRTSDDILDLSVRKSHEQSLDLAKESLYRDSIEVRDFTSTTLAIDPNKISLAKELIRKYQDELSDLLESGQQTEVYRLSMQLFPLSQLKLGEKL